MSKMKTAAWAVAAIVSLASIVTVAQAAENGRSDGQYPQPKGEQFHKRHNGENPMFAALKLSDAQKAQIKKIDEAYRPQPNNREVSEQDRQNWQAERAALLKSKTFDAERARALIARQQQNRENTEIKRLEHEHAVFQVLTPNQQKIFLQEQAKRKPMPPRMKPGEEPRPMPQNNGDAPDAQ